MHLDRSLMMATALSPHIGYDKVAEIVQHAQATGITLREAAIAMGLVSAEEFDSWVNPVKIILL